MMLSLFAISITPRQVLHDLVTGHRHQLENQSGNLQVQQSQSSFQCEWNQQDIVSPFTTANAISLGHPAVLHISHVVYFVPGYHSDGNDYSSLRGPPNCA
jgi:hypothetical protein